MSHGQSSFSTLQDPVEPPCTLTIAHIGCLGNQALSFQLLDNRPGVLLGLHEVEDGGIWKRVPKDFELDLRVSASLSRNGGFRESHVAPKPSSTYSVSQARHYSIYARGCSSELQGTLLLGVLTCLLPSAGDVLCAKLLARGSVRFTGHHLDFCLKKELVVTGHYTLK